MIAVDTSTLVAYFAGDPGSDVEILDAALADRQVRLPPVVLIELLSDAGLPKRTAELLEALPLLAPLPGFWARAGRLLARVLAARRKARLADSLIAQSCIDHRVRLVTRDRDFRTFAKVSKLGLVVPG